ncbi:trithorax group protein osa-like isoform X2 [Dermacentor silvarum]|nr:trithorax group protein osa-like isoform X2 [Dermacentor silvarum]
MAHQHNQSSKPPADDDEIRSIPLPCYGRGQPLIPLEDLPVFQFLKRQATTQGKRIGKGRGRRPPYQNSRPSSDESSDVEHKKDVGIIGCSSRTPPFKPASNSGLEPMKPAQERSEGIIDWPSTSQQSPGPQSSHSADRPRHAPHTSGPPTSRHHQTDRPTRRSSQPSPSRLQQRHSVPPGKGSTKGPSGSDCHGGARRKRPTTSRNTGQGASQSARKARCPAKKASFDPKTFRHATDLSAWAESLNCASYIPDDELEDDGPYVQVSTLRREAEAEHYDMLTFPPDFEDELTDCSEDEARQHESGGPSTGGTPAAAVEEKSMETEESEEPKKDEAEFEDEIIRDPEFLLYVLGNLPGVDSQSETVRNAVREVTQRDRAKKDKGALDKGKSSKDKQ